MSVDQTINQESAAFPPINATEVARAIENIYSVLRPWCGVEWANTEAAKCNVSSFANIVQTLQFQGRKFATAVDLSVKTSQDGITLALNSLTFLSAIEERDGEEVLLYFKGLLGIATSSFEKAKKCESTFDEIRFRIIKISKYVPEAIQAVRERRVRLEENARRSEAIAECCQVGKEAIKDVQMVKGNFPDISPADQGLQIALPVIQTVAHFVEHTSRKKCEECKQGIEALLGAFKKLRTLDTHLSNVYLCLQTLVKWWSNIKAQLEKIKDNLKNHGISFYRHDIRNSVHASWIYIKEEYSKYRDEVSLVQDRCYDMISPDEMGAGRKGVSLNLQDGIEDFYEGLTNLTVITGTKADDHTRLQLALSSIQVAFISRLKMIDNCLEKLLRCIKATDPIQRDKEYRGLVISTFFDALFNQDRDYALTCAQELDNVRYLLTWDFSATSVVLKRMKMRLKNTSLRTEAFQIISKMEEKNKEISNISVDLFANGLWSVNEDLEERLLQTRQKCTWLQAKLEHGAAGDSSREVSPP